LEEEKTSIKVLVCDDDPQDQKITRVYLCLRTDWAIKVLEAKNGCEAVEIAVRESPDIILMDIMMPEVDGLTACYLIKTGSKTCEIPVIMLTAVDHDLNKKLSQKVMGADGYLTKLFTPEDLRGVITQFIRNPE
jgi:CheY-like chemotaxis protein